MADLQVVAARRGRDAEVTRMIRELRRRSAEFTALWDTHDVGLRRNDHKRIVHPNLGVIELECLSLFSEDGRQRLLRFTAPSGSRAAEQPRLLSVIGTQDMTERERTAQDSTGPARGSG